MPYFAPTLRRPALFLLLLAGILAVEIRVVHSTAFAHNPAALSLAVLFDLTIVTSGLFYWLIGKPNGWSVARTGLVALLMARVALVILPANALPATLSGPALLGMLEGIVAIVAGFRVRTIVQTYRQRRPTTDADTALQGSLSVVFGQRAAGAMAGEWRIMRYVLLGWWLKSDVPPTATRLTTHQQSGQLALTITLGVVGLIELAGTHLLLTRWNTDVAFWTTLASAYGMLFLMADAIATIKRPSYIIADTMHLRLGIRWQAVIRREQIVRIQTIHEKPAKNATTLNAAFLTAPNVLLTLREPVTVQGPYGIQKNVSTITLWLDGGRAVLFQS